MQAPSTGKPLQVCLAMFLSLPVFAYSQQAAAPGGQEGRIKLDVVVTDKSGAPQSGLELKDFSVLDNNQPVKILSFHAPHTSGDAGQDAGPPVEVILLIDKVNLEFKEVAFVRQEVEKFLSQNGGHLAQPVSLFVLTNRGLDVQQQPSVDGNKLAADVRQLDNSLRTDGPSAGVNGAIQRFYISVQALTALAQSEAKKPGRKLLIWTGPGWPMLDSVNIEISTEEQRRNFDKIVTLSTVLREARISVYSVSSTDSGGRVTLYRDFLKGVKSPAKSSPANLGLKVLAIQSGGRVLGPDNQLAAQIDSCFKDAGSFYSLSFDPPRTDHANEYHDIKVLVQTPGLTPRTSTGYYDQP
jgi:VWFA-related protein